MTDDELGEELRQTMRAVAESYEPTATGPATARPAKPLRLMPLVLAAAALALIAGVAFALIDDDDAADLDVRDETTTTTVPIDPPSTSQPDAAATGVADWTWTVGEAAPIHFRADAEIVWTTDEVVVWGGTIYIEPGWDTTGGGYDPVADTWRRVTSVEEDLAARLRADDEAFIEADLVLPPTHEALGHIRYGEVNAVIDAETGKAAWRLRSGAVGIALPPPPDDSIGFDGAAAVWTGDALVVWGGIRNDCGEGRYCGDESLLTPFVLTPPAGPAPVLAPPTDSEPIAVDDIAGITWVLYGIEVDGERIVDDEPGTISLELTVPTAASAPLTASGWAGCFYEVNGISEETGRVSWGSPPETCDGISEVAAAFLDTIGATVETRLADGDGWPTPFLYLDGDGVRILLVPATDNTVVGPASAPPPTTTTAPIAPTTTAAPPSDPPLHLADIVDSIWILTSLNIDGTTVPDDEDADITLEMRVTGLPNLDSAELTITGQSGCDYTAAVLVESVGGISVTDTGSLTWSANPAACAGTSSALAAAYLTRLGDATESKLAVGSPDPILELTGNGVRFRFRAVDRPPPPPPPPPPTVPHSADPIETSQEPVPGLSWELPEAPHGDLDGWSYGIGDEIVTVGSPSDGSALIGQGQHRETGMWRELPTKTILPREFMVATVWTGTSVAVFAKSNDFGELIVYTPTTDTWDNVAYWDSYAMPNYEVILMEMRDGEIHIEADSFNGAGRIRLTWDDGLYGGYESV